LKEEKAGGPWKRGRKPEKERSSPWGQGRVRKKQRCDDRVIVWF